MKYVVLLYEDESVFPALSEAEQATYLHAHNAFDAAVEERGTLLGGNALQGSDTATTLRRRSGKAELTDGPYAETVEHLGGFYVVDAPDLDTMTGLCELLPEAYTIEIRPVLDMTATFERLEEADARASTG